MRILHESADELTILSPARAARILALVLLAIGLLVALPIGLRLLSAGVASLSGPPAEPVWGVPAPLLLILAGALLCLPAVGGLVGLLRARDTEYHFLGSQRKLIVRDRYREREVIPFSEIVKAVAYTTSGNDEPDTYGLRLQLRGFFRNLQLSQVDGSGDVRRRRTEELADRINRFLETHPSEPQEATPKDEPKGIARLKPVTVSSENKRRKRCPSCGRDLNVYAVKCRFCNADAG
jgi:hypothetical protein